MHSTVEKVKMYHFQYLLLWHLSWRLDMVMHYSTLYHWDFPKSWAYNKGATKVS
jgi:hypothetical protein